MTEQAYRCETLEIISDAVGMTPVNTYFLETPDAIYSLSRRQHHVGSYFLKPLPSPLLVIHLAGKSPVYYDVKNSYETKDSDKAENSGISDYCIPGDLLTVAANTQSTWQVNGEVEILIFSLAEYSSGKSKTPHKDTPYFQSNIFQQKISSGSTDSLTIALLRQLLLQCESDEDDSEYSNKLLETLLLHLNKDKMLWMEQTDKSVGKGPALQISEIIKYICGHLSEDLSTSKLSSLAEINASYFSEVFKQHTGLPPHKYILRKRVERARELLQSTTLPIACIAEETGFSSQSHMTATFSRVLEHSPSEIRKRVKKTIHTLSDKVVPTNASASH